MFDNAMLPGIGFDTALHELHNIVYENVNLRVYTEDEIRNFDLDLPEHRELIRSPVLQLGVSDQSVPTEWSPLPTVIPFAPVLPIYASDNSHQQWSAQESTRAHQPRAALRLPPFNGSTGANNPQVQDTPILGNNHYEHQPALHSQIQPPPSSPATAPRDISSAGQGINPASRAKAAKPKAGAASNPSQYRLKRTAKEYRRQQTSTASRTGLQYGEPESNQTMMSHRTPKARLHPSSENTLVELDKHRDESYGRSRLARGRAGLSHVEVPASQATISNGVSLERRQPQPTPQVLKWKYYEPPSAEAEAGTPSPHLPSTTSTASEGSRWTSLPASPDPPSSSSAICSPSAASASSTSSSSSSSHNQSRKRKRGDGPSASSSRPAKKSKPRGKGTMCMQVPLRLRHVVVDPSLPRPEGNWRPSTGKGRIQVWLEQDEVEVKVEVEGDGMEMEDEVEI